MADFFFFLLCVCRKESRKKERRRMSQDLSQFQKRAESAEKMIEILTRRLDFLENVVQNKGKLVGLEGKSDEEVSKAKYDEVTPQR